ncbi:rRNA maturation RNase YbeY [Candidatus Riesia pediculischaeffi]|uniref:Endoribonuclease YbeY n=1 Tax=Candidatus Riesia pediculischaeffi TaxID=428411 RepID=A0A1V0HKV1_9ENTR|nr:rRNA maturation RNase YbeY [Candidatus Riesia pediculischaeffi]ARC53460.1 hypothetical protein AOQ87_02280 [Candidatus Riesia pediculischaeffi]
MKVYISHIYRIAPNFIGFLNRKNFKNWINRVLSHISYQGEITIHIASLKEITFLNRVYRGHDHATNILSFPFDEKKFNFSFIGDLVVCHQILEEEAITQKKTIDAHWAHIILHGCLHLLGMNHDNRINSKKMENMEVKILSQLGYPDPFQ